LNGKVDEVKLSAEQVNDSKFYKDVEMDRESQSMVFDQITNCSKNINDSPGDEGYDDHTDDDSQP
jgi:hypothetical protein